MCYAMANIDDYLDMLNSQALLLEIRIIKKHNIQNVLR